MADIQYWNETLIDEIEAIRSLVGQASDASVSSRKASLLDQADKKIRMANGTKRSFKMECRLVADPNAKRQYEQELAKHEKDLISLKQEISSLKSGNSKQELFDGANAGTSGEQDGDSLLKDASRIQDKTQDSLDNTKRLVEESKETGMNTLEQLHQQREQIERIDNDVDRIEDNLQRADRLIKTFSKRMATDKLIQSFTCINVCLLVGIVVWAIFRESDDGSSSTPPSPVRRMLKYLRQP